MSTSTTKQKKTRLITLQNAAEQLSMSRQSVMNHVKRGLLKCVRLASNSVYFRPEHLEDFIEGNTEVYMPLRKAA